MDAREDAHGGGGYPHAPVTRVRTPIAALAALLALAFPGIAAAGFAPRLDVHIDPSTPSTPTATAVAIQQSSTDEASRRIEIAFPQGFAAAAATPAACSPDQEAQRACPESSRIGAASATTGFGSFNGGVYFGGPAGAHRRLIVFLSNGVFLFDRTLDGALADTGSGLVETFDNLADQPMQAFNLSLEGGPRSLVLSPSACGDYTFIGRFVSQSGVSAQSSAGVKILGCAEGSPSLAGVSLLPPRLALGQGATLSFTLSEPAAVTVALLRRGKPLPGSARTVAGRAGANSVPGIGHEARRAGVYPVEVRATDS
ncbi:MAG TPA: hypothetical protein VHE14_05095, partial [Solirubrobacteraceae bacterium]|nr:hypothetical protein [Solirubrobacteraceae bacterium]